MCEREGETERERARTGALNNLSCPLSTIHDSPSATPWILTFLHSRGQTDCKPAAEGSCGNSLVVPRSGDESSATAATARARL